MLRKASDVVGLTAALARGDVGVGDGVNLEHGLGGVVVVDVGEH